MRILLLSDANSIHTKRWVEALSHRGCEIVLFSLAPNESDFYNKLPGVTVVGSRIKAKKHLWPKIQYLNLLSKLHKLINIVKPDIVHAHYASSYGLIGALAKSKKIPYIVSVWGSDVYDFPNMLPFGLGRNIIRFNLKKADYILSTSHVMAKETKKYTDKPIQITPFGVDTELFKPINQPDSEEFVIGNVKTLRPKYGIDVLIRAADIVMRNNPDKKIRLDIYGEGPQKDELVRLSQSLGIADKVSFKGFVQNHRLPEVYNSFSVSVSVSVSNSESFGVVAVEAMACECPVVTSDADGFTEVVDDGVTGFIVPKNDAEAAAKAIQRFIDTPELRAKMGAEGRNRVLNLYDWEHNVDTMVAIYNEVVKNKKR